MDYKNVYEALVGVNKGIHSIAKTAYNSFFKFKYAPLSEVYEVCRTALFDNGTLYMTRIVGNSISQTKTMKDKVEKITNYANVEMEFCFHYGESHTEWFRWIGEANDNGDKTYSKAISFAEKTALLAFFMIPRKDADDPDFSGATAKATPHQQASRPNSQEAKFSKAKSFYWNLFGKENLNWIDKESTYHATFKKLCIKAKTTTYMKTWDWETVEEIRKLMGDSGVKISYTTVINEALCNAIKKNVTQYLNVNKKPNTLL